MQAAIFSLKTIPYTCIYKIPKDILVGNHASASYHANRYAGSIQRNPVLDTRQNLMHKFTENNALKY